MKDLLTNFFVFPIGNPKLNNGKNPYIFNLINAIEKKNNNVVNKSNFTILGIFSLLRYILKADVFIFNWLESLQENRFGKLQSISLPFLLFFLRILGKKIIFVFHNKHPHNGTSFFSKINIFFSVFFASKIVTHAKEGKIYLKNKFRKLIKQEKVSFVHHPVYSSELISFENKENKFDYIIWGAISPYKGIYEFLEFIKYNPQYKSKRILICGKVSSYDFKKRLFAFDLDNVKIIDAFISEKKLIEYISISKAILFVYTGDSVLSSGALIKSLNFNKPIIGPRKGAFKDLEELKIVNCYHTFDNIFNSSVTYRKKEIIKFISRNNWDILISNIL